MPVRRSPVNAESLQPWLERCGYVKANLLQDLPLSGGRVAAWAGFSQRPFDNRSACIIAMDVTSSPAEDAAACGETGAPVAFLCGRDHLHWWRQSPAGSREYDRVPADQLEGFFREHQDDFKPQTIYRAKTLGRFDATEQRDFVDLGLLPMVEKANGETIERLLLDQVASLREALGWPRSLSEDQGQWLVRAVFWLLGAKMLHDKRVESFIRLDFGNVDQVFDRLARHYDQSAEAIVSTEAKRDALQNACNAIARRADLRLATTEALAYVYENTLITREVRKGLGTHSTPAYLIDYILGRLAPLIEAMPQDKRIVFEPTCGHAGFLVAAVRLLTSLLPPEMAAPAERRTYLRQRIFGCDKDTFALEIARLSLTLTDIPNPNGWNLKEDDIFGSDQLETSASKSRILLANPPFESLKPAQRDAYAGQFRAPRFVNKAAEILHRSVTALPVGGVFGLVVPQNLLHSKDAVEFRRILVQQTEFEEICLFPDKVFNFADVESAILVGRKTGGPVRPAHSFCYRRVREGKMAAFRENYEVTSEVTVPTSRFDDSDNWDLRVPDLEEVWAACAHLPTMDEFVEIGQGLSFIGKDQPEFPKGLRRTSPVPREGFVEGFENLGEKVMSHQLPPMTYLNLDPAIVRVAILGTTVGIPQVILNEAPIQRAPWCVKGMVDSVGRPATTRFTLMRPRGRADELSRIWALINSPVAAAFAYTHSTKRDIITGTWRRMSVPQQFFDNVPHERALVAAINNYLTAVHEFENTFTLASDGDIASRREALKFLHWRIDAEVLKLYALPVELERMLLDYFEGHKRVGVPFDQDRYFPEGFDVPMSLADFLAITADWEETNARRLALIALKQNAQLSRDEQAELTNLKRLARARSALVMPLPMRELEEQETDLRRRGLWKGV